MPTVTIPPAYRGPTRGADRIDVEGGTVRDCIQVVANRFPGFGDQVFDAKGDVHRFVTLFINGDEIDRNDVDRAVGPGDEVEILAAVAGG
jgi:molybdopterin converting factor small subunit